MSNFRKQVLQTGLSCILLFRDSLMSFAFTHDYENVKEIFQKRDVINITDFLQVALSKIQTTLYNRYGRRIPHKQIRNIFTVLIC